MPNPREIPADIDLEEVKVAIDYLIGVEAYNLFRSNVKNMKYKFDESHFRKFMKWLEK